MPSQLLLSLWSEILVAKINMDKPLYDRVVLYSPKAYFAILNRILLVESSGDYYNCDCDCRIGKLMKSIQKKTLFFSFLFFWAGADKGFEAGNCFEERTPWIEERTSCVEARMNVFSLRFKSGYEFGCEIKCITQKEKRTQLSMSYYGYHSYCAYTRFCVPSPPKLDAFSAPERDNNVGHRNVRILVPQATLSLVRVTVFSKSHCDSSPSRMWSMAIANWNKEEYERT
ncbi:hypothetical protein C8R41DRAFT_863689 [Lentinula lateritia]|uniref:Uncharacterized protein n=1 Tax=Lentinula lateritia TaxID=40482 RepID=A0ABQ8VUK9_9AGAR|nr:hypothetical protein C8R41DRAFT_863689 [Lentinula lateritia]